MPTKPTRPTAHRTMPIDRREFIEGVALATAGLAVARTADAAPTAAEVTWHRAPCRLCGVGCGLLVGVQEGRAVAVKGDPDATVNRGLACVKGYHAAQALYGVDRITRALVRRSGRLVPVPMPEALDLVARRMQETMNRHGADAVAAYGSAQWSVTDAYVAARFFRGALGTSRLDTSARLHTASAIAGIEGAFGAAGAVGGYDDIEHADVFVLWDLNMAETDPVLFSRLLARRRANAGVRLIALTPRACRTSYACDRTLLFAPRSDIAIANAICQEIVARGWVDRDFVARHVAFKRGRTGIGYALQGEPVVADAPVDATFDEYRAFLADYTPERAQALSGVPADAIRWVASLFGDRRGRVMTLWGSASAAHGRGTWLNNVLYNLHLLTGRIAAPGDAAICLTGQPSSGSLPNDAGALAGTLPRGALANEGDRRRAAGIWGDKSGRLDPRAASSAMGTFRALGNEVRFLWVMGTNPMVSLPNLSRYRTALGKGDRFLVVTEAYPTATTDVADVVLPAAMWLEREGLYANAERRVQHFGAVVRAPGDATSDAWQMLEVARRLGVGGGVGWTESRHVQQAYDEYRRFFDDPQQAMPDLEALRSRAGVRWPVSGGRETRWRYSTAFDPAADRALGAFDFYGHADHRAWIWLRPHEPPAERPGEGYPFWLLTGRVLEHWGTGAMTRRIPTLHRALPHAYVEVNREDADVLGVRDGDRVRLTSRRGTLELEARIDYRSQPPRGVLFAPTFDEGAPVNRLMNDACCPLSGQPDHGACAVRVERAATGATR